MSKQSHQKEQEIFNEFLLKKSLKKSQKRDHILEVFWALHSHVTAEELYNLVKAKHPTIGYTTVYRTLKLLCDSHLAIEHKFVDGISRYEHLYGHEHHDHLMCTKCGKVEEFVEADIERLQNKVFKSFGYQAESHKMELYGICPDCITD